MRRELKDLREYMRKNEIDIYIVPSSDAHQGEYVGDHFKGRAWLTGFTGSAGTAVVTRKGAGVWTDGRYFIQAERELSESGFELFRAGEAGVPSYDEWIGAEAESGCRVAFDGRVVSQNTFEEIHRKLEAKNPQYIIHRDALNTIWEGRPELPKEVVYNHELTWAGESREEKLKRVRENMEERGADMYMLSSLDDIAWLLNLRGGDVKNTPLFYSYAIVEMENTLLFVDMAKIDEELEEVLNSSGVDIMGYEEVGDYLLEKALGRAIICDPARTSRYIYSFLEEGEIIREPDITTKLKARKNEIERKNVRTAYLKDCAALAKFAYYMETEGIGLTEVEAERVLEGFRGEEDSFQGNSFDPIAGYGEHGAMMHFKASRENTFSIEEKGFFLIDSGGQYLEGTTDITRTLVMGELSHEERMDFTLSLQGLIDLSSTRFLKGTTGYALDCICRRPMWNAGLDYKCGTGHGIGFFLNIHEGPCGFGQRAAYNNPLEPGNLITIEPGVYKEGRHGIRHENTVFVRESMTGEFGEFYELETLTYFPIDTRGILVEELTRAQREWLNEYHKEVFEKLSPLVECRVLEWLRERTGAI